MNLVSKLFFNGHARRKKILINPEFQLKLINRVVYLFTFTLITFYSVNYYFFYQLKQKGVIAGLSLNSDYFLFIDNTFKQFNIFFIFTAIFLILIIYYFGLAISHKIAGPLYNIDNACKKMIQEKRTIKITLRKDDYFQEHAECINQLLDSQDFDKK